MDNFSKTYMQMFYGIEVCIENKLQFPTLTLIYSLIDSLAYIAYGDKQVGKNFVKWVDEYMYKEKKLDITPDDLYSARNAIIHTLTPNSRDTRKKNTAVVAYAWGDADLKVAKKSLEISKYENLKFIYINDLLESLKLGTSRFIDSDLNNEVKKRMNEHYTNMSQETLEKFNNLHS